MALGWLARERGLNLPLIENILLSDSRHLETAVALVLAARKQRIGVLGLVFKSDSDDLRESPACELVKRLIDAGKRVKVYDPRVRLDHLLVANQTFIRKELPLLPRLMASSYSALTKTSDVIVLAGTHPKFEAVVRGITKGKMLIDLVGLKPDVKWPGIRCQGLT